MHEHAQRKPRSLTTLCMMMPLPRPTCPARQEIDPGRLKVKNYDLLKWISRGAAGELWLARHRKTRDLHAIKFVWKDPSGISSWYDREATAYDNYRRITEKNSNLVRILDSGRAAGDTYFFYIMEAADDIHRARDIDPGTYTPRTLLQQIQEHGQIPFECLIEWMDGLLNGLGFLHKHLVVHQDLKPSNIIFVAGRPKLADVGLLTRVGPDRTVGEGSVGTVGYMAPESRRTFQSDIYNFGKLAYEMMTGMDRLDYPALPPGFLDRPEKDRWLALNKIICQACHPNPRRRQGSVSKLRKQIGSVGERRSKQSFLFAWFLRPFRRHPRIQPLKS